ncbi:aliphatic sulfonates import ATP-binding protein SsuB [Halolactibacillus alkaliphilus]|uniref:Aliphatic sulfonates import ATP-binding protein SsuB n=1 Tax=Halolactibacillus alkaliphilus TaxID=442899 RepID=A0A511X1X5_9BACI|nr:ABC transporter ATP-binding protein [Halolactibacillus alkaliphilus]GEN56958.1 aliphatic sulfonates import ATP-binding protein SsuB [Halolactibacillus alkaliphilus]GGN70706.1 aliphatic sulfonates import ATP-binding protein SsuB [Halolactibacillus alkaliphilus]SFO84071.1 sulfonate transport system ATP-binding protein [Halolactibacillus alkaliphilus]
MTLTLENVSRSFQTVTAIKQINLTIKKGEVICLLGKSGCGKSTLLRTLSGLDQEYSGKIYFEGTPLTGVREEIGFIFQEPRLLPWLNVIDNIQFGLKQNDEQTSQRVHRFIQYVGLKGKEYIYPKALSGGMSQRAAIARALVCDPEVLLLDEPFSALDHFTKLELQDLLLKIQAKYKTTMVMVTHDIDEALYLADRIVVLSSQPGTIQQIVEVTQPRPRTRTSDGLKGLKEKILKTLHVE